MSEIELSQKQRVVDPYKRFPGNIKYVNNIGCKAIEFESFVNMDTGVRTSATEQMNDFFKVNNGAVAVLVEILPSGNIFCLYTIQLTDDEIEIINIRAEIINKMVEEEVQKRQAAQEAEQEALEKAEAERSRLVVKGKKCEHDHGGMDKVKEELAKVKRYARKHNITLPIGTDEENEPQG